MPNILNYSLYKNNNITYKLADAKNLREKGKEEIALHYGIQIP